MHIKLAKKKQQKLVTKQFNFVRTVQNYYQFSPPTVAVSSVHSRPVGRVCVCVQRYVAGSRLYRQCATLHFTACVFSAKSNRQSQQPQQEQEKTAQR